MNAPSQTTPVGWFYADAKPSTAAATWDGAMWPKITGYRSSGQPEILPAGFVDQLVQVQLPDQERGSVKVARQLSQATTPYSAADVPANEGRAAIATESHATAVAVALGEDGRASASGTLRLYVFLALLLAVAGMIIGVVL